MTEQEREIAKQKYLENIPWPSEGEMRSFLADCERDPIGMDAILANIRELEVQANAEVVQGKV